MVKSNRSHVTCQSKPARAGYKPLFFLSSLSSTITCVQHFPTTTMAYKSALLILILSLLSISLAQTSKGCRNSVVPTPRPESSWVSEGYGYQVFDIIIVNQTPGNCSAIQCSPEFYFINCDILSTWNWNATCTNCEADGSHGSEATYTANAIFWAPLGPGEVSLSIPLISSHSLLFSPLRLLSSSI